MDMTEDVVDPVARKIYGSAGPGGTDLEDLQGWLLNYISVESLMDWMANQIPPWAAYQEFISVRLIALDKQLGVRLVGVGETWRWLFSKCVMKFTWPEATHACKDYQICAGLKVLIDV